MSIEQTTPSSQAPAQGSFKRPRLNPWQWLVKNIGPDNISLLLALVLLVAFITNGSSAFGLEGGDKFFTWQNLMNSLAQAVVIVGLLAIGETVVIVAGGLDISVGSVASIGSVVAASTLVGVGTVGSLSFIPQNNVYAAVMTGIAAGAIAGAVNGLIVTVLRVNPSLPRWGRWRPSRASPSGWCQKANLWAWSPSRTSPGWHADGSLPPGLCRTSMARAGRACPSSP
ncbi:MAG: ABC transporter permease [Anaerolineae bacterium]|nr:ABC transporter permease [Anaerolineae bacterium]